jgi:hypothetical protein
MGFRWCSDYPVGSRRVTKEALEKVVEQLLEHETLDGATFYEMIGMPRSRSAQETGDAETPLAESSR